MAEEVSLKIILSDDDQTASHPAAAAPPPAQPTPTPRPVMAATPAVPAVAPVKAPSAVVTPAPAAPAVAQAPVTTPSPAGAAPGFNPTQTPFTPEELKQIHQRYGPAGVAGLQGAYPQLFTPAQPAPAVTQAPAQPAAFDPVAAAKEKMERERRAMLTKAAYENLQGPGTVLPATPEQPGILSQIGGVFKNLGMGQVGGLFGGLGKLNAGAGAVGAGAQAMAGAGAGGIALGGLASAAGGPVGLALTLADVAGKKLAGTINEVSENIQKVGSVAVSLAGNDNLGALTKGADMAGEALGKVPIVGQVWEAEVKAMTTVVRTFTAVTEAVIARGAALAKYSPEITTAGAMAQIRQIRSDMREARVLGPSMASITDSYSRASERFAAAIMPIKKFLLEKLAVFLDKIAAFMENAAPVIAGMLEATLDIGEIISDFVSGHWETMKQHIAKLPEKIAKAMKEAQKLDEKGPLNWLRDLNEQAQDMARGAMQDHNVGRVTPDRLNVPAFQF